MLQGHWGHEMSSPAKAAKVILQLASKEQLPAHLLLGSDPCSMPALPRKSGNPTPGMAQRQRLNRRGGCEGVARFEVLKLCWRGCGDPWHASILSIDVA